MKLLLQIILFIVLNFYSVQAQLDFDPITKLLQDSISIIGQSGQHCGFMIVSKDSVLYKQYFGTWNDTTYQPIASGSKLPSMMLMMKLIDEGYIRQTDTLQKYLPSFNSKPIITIHQLMNHTSGLPGQSPFISTNALTLQQAVDSIGLKTPMTKFAPGTAFQYGGVSMQVAGRIAEIATGKRWDSLFNEKISQPLLLTNSDYIALGATENYRIAGGMGTTMPDFAKMLQLLLNKGEVNNKQYVDSSILEMQKSNQTGNLPLESTPYDNDELRSEFRYGYGVWVEKEENSKTTQYGSQGAFGFTPWIDECRGIACVFFVRRTLSAIQPTHTKLRELVEQIIPYNFSKPTISQTGNQLRSNYTSNNQWYRNDTILNGEINQTISPSQNGKYKVLYTSNNGCSLFSDAFNYAITSTQIELKNDVTIKPVYNTSSQSLSVENSEGVSMVIQLVDMLGNIVFEKEASTSIIVDVSTLQENFLLVRIITTEGVLIEKILR